MEKIGKCLGEQGLGKCVRPKCITLTYQEVVFFLCLETETLKGVIFTIPIDSYPVILNGLKGKLRLL